MFVCQCHAVTDRQVHAAIEGGCASVSSVARAPGAGTGCGGCVDTLRRMVCEACPMASAPSASMIALAGGGAEGPRPGVRAPSPARHDVDPVVSEPAA